MEENEQEKISKYNSGVFIIQRLHNLWLDANEHSRNGEFAKWNNDLDRIWLEIARDLSDTQLKDDKDEHGNIKKDKHGKLKKGKLTEFQEFDERLAKTGEIRNSGKIHDFQKKDDGNAQVRNEQYKILMDKEFFLRRLENETGKGTKFEDTTEDDMD